MVKHTQTIRRQQPTNCLSVFDHFVGLALKGWFRINYTITIIQTLTKRILTTRSSRSEVFCKKGVLKNFTKFTGKHLCQSLFFNKVAGLL